MSKTRTMTAAEAWHAMTGGDTQQAHGDATSPASAPDASAVAEDSAVLRLLRSMPYARAEAVIARADAELAQRAQLDHQWHEEHDEP